MHLSRYSGCKLVGLTRAELLMEAGQLQAAADLLETLRQKNAKDPQLLKLSLQVYRALQQWDRLAPLLPQLRKSKLMAEGEAQTLERQVYGGLLATASGPQTQANLDKVWASCPDVLRRDVYLVSVYARGLLGNGSHTPAEKPNGVVLEGSTDLAQVIEALAKL